MLDNKADLSSLNNKVDISAMHSDYILDANGNKINANKTIAWRTKNSWFISEFQNGETTYTYDPPLECVWKQISYRYSGSEDAPQ